MPGAFNRMDQLPTTIPRDGACSLGTATGTKGKRPLRALSASDKIDAIQRVNEGESKASVARDIGVPESTLRGWCKNEDKLRYMSSRHSTPDTDKSSDGMTEGHPPEKRTKFESAAINYSQNGSSNPAPAALPQYEISNLSVRAPTEGAGLDLSRVKKETETVADQEMAEAAVRTDFSCFTRATMDLSKNKATPELNNYSSDIPATINLKDTKPPKLDPGATMSMSAISPLSGLNHLSGLSGLGQSHLGLSFNEIATNLSLIAQLNPSLSALTNSINSSAKALRSIRSPKPGHNTSSSGLNMNDIKHKSSGKSHHHSDGYSEKTSRSSRSSHNTYKEPPMDDTLWYWFKKQQAMLNLAQTSHTPLTMPHSMPSSRSNKESSMSHSTKPVTSIPSMVPPLDALNKNSWFWQYYKQFTGNLGLQDDKMKLLSMPKPESYENILYSHLMKEKMDFATPQEEAVDCNVKLESKIEEAPRKECSTPPETEKLEKEPANKNNSTRARAVLDNLLFNNNNNNNNVTFKQPDPEEGEKDSNAENEFGCEVIEALEHGEKFLRWLEACQEPSVTRMQVHQLKGMLNNIKANAERRNQNGSMKDRVSRRK